MFSGFGMQKMLGNIFKHLGPCLNTGKPVDVVKVHRVFVQKTKEYLPTVNQGFKQSRIHICSGFGKKKDVR